MPELCTEAIIMVLVVTPVDGRVKQDIDDFEYVPGIFEN